MTSMETLLAVVNALGVVCGFLIVRLLNSITHRLDKLEETDNQLTREVGKTNQKMAEEYVTKIEFVRITDAIFRKLDTIQNMTSEKLDRLYGALDSKANKSDCGYMHGPK